MAYHGNKNKNKTWIAILILDKECFRAKEINRDGEEHYIMINPLW